MKRRLLIDDGRSEREMLLSGTVCVGRDPSCHIHELDPLLSRRHAEFVWQKQHVTIRDLGSRNGILVNGLKVPEKILVSGDVVQLGSLQLRYVEDQNVTTPDETARARERTDTALETPTMAPVRGKDAPPHADTKSAPIPFTAGDLDATFAPGMVDMDATFAPGAKTLDPDATFVAPGHDPDETVIPSLAAHPAAVAAPVVPGSFDVTMAPVRSTAPAPAPPAAGDARLVVDRQMIVTEANPECAGLFGVGPDALVGGSIGEVVLKSLGDIATGKGPASLSITVSRTPSDRTITMTFKAGQAVETVS